ncbi:hypothetical protein L3081_05995 [Colwellia sp. MSW7]|uniref:Uncharacterized protein n=1 Tax=Colwellia maritima TaxID=2912588 RepID=A0ABS9WZS3_9GAMM|nr:hypothetical protein [Colwellia maritima]MCI2283032.1 hypothetical protein [Colwellia maritima]
MRVMRAIFNFAKYEYRGNENEIIYKDNPVKILSHLRLNVGTYTIKRLLNHKTKRDDVTADILY